MVYNAKPFSSTSSYSNNTTTRPIPNNNNNSNNNTNNNNRNPDEVYGTNPNPAIYTSIGLAGGNSDGNPPSTKPTTNVLAGQIYLVEELKKQEFCLIFPGEPTIHYPRVLKKNPTTNPTNSKFITYEYPSTKIL